MAYKEEAVDKEELEIAQKEADSSPDVFEIKFKTPVEYNGKSYESLRFNFDKLTGNDAQKIENELQSLGKAVVVPSISGEFLVRMAAKACDEPISADFIFSLKLKDYERIRGAARSFLLKAE